MYFKPISVNEMFQSNFWSQGMSHFLQALRGLKWGEGGIGQWTAVSNEV